MSDENGDQRLGPWAEQQPVRVWNRGWALTVGFAISTGSVVVAILTAVTGTTNNAGFSTVEIIKQSVIAFALAMVVLAVPTLLFAFAAPGKGQPMSGGRAVAMSVATLFFCAAIVVVDFVVWALLSLSLDPPSDDA